MKTKFLTKCHSILTLNFDFDVHANLLLGNAPSLETSQAASCPERAGK